MRRHTLLREAIRGFLISEQDEPEELDAEAAVVVDHLGEVRAFFIKNESAVREVLDSLDTIGAMPLEKIGTWDLSALPELKATLASLARIDKKYPKDFPFGIIMFGKAIQGADLDNIMFSIRAIVDFFSGKSGVPLEEARGRYLAWFRARGKDTELYRAAADYVEKLLDLKAAESALGDPRRISATPVSKNSPPPVKAGSALSDGLKTLLEKNFDFSDILRKLSEKENTEIADVLAALDNTNKTPTLENIKALPDKTPGKRDAIDALEDAIESIAGSEDVLSDLVTAKLRSGLTTYAPSVRASLPGARLSKLIAGGLTLLDLAREVGDYRPVIPAEALNYVNQSAINDAESIETIADVAGDYFDETTTQSALIQLAEAVRQSTSEAVSPSVQSSLGLLIDAATAE